MTALTSLEVVSASANDTSAGTGARGVTITGLDDTFAEISSTVALNGTTAVPIPIQFYRVNSISITSVGTGLRNLGQINVRDAGGGTVRSIIPIATVADLSPGVSRGSQYTVPAGHTLLIHDIDLQINSSAGGAARGADAVLYFRSSTANAPVRLPRAISCTDTYAKNLDPKTRIALPAGTDFQLRASYTSNAGMVISGSWEGNLVRRIP